MAYSHPLAIEHHRKRWTRPDAYRFAAPGTPEAKRPGYLHPWTEVARQEQAVADEAKARALAEQDAFEREVLALRHDLAKLRLEYELRRFQRKYSADQPRVPAGNPDGGQWTDGGREGAGRNDSRVLPDAMTDDRWKPGAQYAENSSDPFLNKHVIDQHVDKTDEELKARIRAEQLRGLFVTVGRDRNGSFDSRESARDFISRTIENNQETVAAVASGKVSDAFLTWRFGYQTGREAILDLDTSTIRMRPTYNVGVLITHDPSADLGYRVVTAFPRNYNPRVGR